MSTSLPKLIAHRHALGVLPKHVLVPEPELKIHSIDFIQNVEKCRTKVGHRRNFMGKKHESPSLRISDISALGEQETRRRRGRQSSLLHQ
jgi:hypothetical protein